MRVVEVPVLADDCVCVNVFVIVGTSHHSQLFLVVQCPVRVVEVPVLADDCVCVNVFVIVGTSHHSRLVLVVQSWSGEMSPQSQTH